MSRRTLTIIDTTSEMREINLDRIGKRELLLGRNAEQCEVVLADPIISKVQGKFLMKKDMKIRTAVMERLLPIWEKTGF